MYNKGSRGAKRAPAQARERQENKTLAYAVHKLEKTELPYPPKQISVATFPNRCHISSVSQQDTVPWYCIEERIVRVTGLPAGPPGGLPAGACSGLSGLACPKMAVVDYIDSLRLGIKKQQQRPDDGTSMADCGFQIYSYHISNIPYYQTTPKEQ